MDIDIKSLIELLKTTPIEYVVWSAFIVFIIWLFKESRNHYLEFTKMNHERIANALEAYAGIYLVLVEDTIKDDAYYVKVSETLALGYPYYTKKLLNTVMNWQREKNAELDSITEILEKEIKYLKSLQNDDISSGSLGDLSIESIYYFFRRSSMGSFIIPAFYTFIFVILFLLLVMFVVVFAQADAKSRILHLSNVFAFSMFSAAVIITIELFLGGKLRSGIKNWSLFILYIIVSTVLILIGPWYRGIVNVVVTFGYVYVCGKYLKNK